jgi:radical SAM superfamily enzyme YgiQ (UPF0313 family)
MKKKLLLVNPKSSNHKGTSIYFSPPIVFGIITKLTPSNWEVEILDECITDFKLIKADLVGITAMVLTANRAYQISEMYRKLNVKTIIGGIHATVLPEEAQKYADCVVVGEAESVWINIINDFENNCLKEIYISSLVPPDKFIIPELSFYNKKTYATPIETSRGCKNACIFCKVISSHNNCYRRKSLDLVLEEIKQIRNNKIFFVDNNFYNQDDDYMESLFRGIINLRKKYSWMAGVTADFFKNKSLLKLAAKSGCVILYTGLEVIDIKSLKELNKPSKLFKDNLKNEYKQMINNCHEYGILFLSNYIIGLESDDEERIKHRIKNFEDLKIDLCNAGLLTPYPGTFLYKQLADKNKLLYVNYPQDWDKYNFMNYIIKNDKLNRENAEKLVLTAYKTLSFKNYILSLIKTKNIRGIKYFYNYCKQNK